MMVDEPRYIRLDGITSSDPTELFEPAAFEALSQELLSPDSCQLHPVVLDRCRDWIDESVSDVLKNTMDFDGHEDPDVYIGGL
jgi:hypothetical protein